MIVKIMTWRGIILYHYTTSLSSLNGTDTIVRLSKSMCLWKKKRYKWSTQAPATRRTRKYNIIPHLRGLKGEARNVVEKTPINCWLLLITDEMIGIIVKCRTDKISDLLHKYEKTATFVNYRNETEKKSVIRITLSWVFKFNHKDVEGLSATDGTGRYIFRVLAPEMKGRQIDFVPYVKFLNYCKNC